MAWCNASGNCWQSTASHPWPLMQVDAAIKAAVRPADVRYEPSRAAGEAALLASERRVSPTRPSLHAFPVSVASCACLAS